MKILSCCNGLVGQGCFRAKAVPVCLALLGAVLLRIAFFDVSVHNVQPSSDESIAMLQAGEIMHGRFPLLFMAQPYLFPIESYIIAPFVRMLPPNAFGARLIPLLMCFATIVISLLVVKKNTSIFSTWVAAILMLFPSSYILTLQSAYALPGYAALPFLGALGVLMALYQRERSSIALALGAGYISALGFSANMLALPFLLFTGSFVCLGTNWRSAVKNSAAFFSGGIIGSLPYLIAKITIPGAYGAVTARHTVIDAISRLWRPTITHALSPVLGARICLFPDGKAISLLGLPLELYGGLFAAILFAAIVMRIHALRRVVAEKWLRIELQDLVVGLVLCSLVEFIFANRADSHSYRYLIVCAWSFPFIVAYIHKSAKPLVRRMLSVFVILLVGLNIISTIVLMGKWRMPDALAKEGLADLQPVLWRLDELGVRHCVASYGAAYRLNYQSGGKITCSQPVNERFPGWPIPYKDVVDSENDVAYVLTDTIRFLKPEIFDRHLRTMNVECKKEPCGDFFIYRDFRNMVDTHELTFLASTNLSFSTSHNSEKASNMNDGSVDTIWTSVVPQEEKMWVQIDLASTEKIKGMFLQYGNYEHDIAGRTDVDLLTNQGWVTVVTNIDNVCDKFIFQHKHPVYGPGRNTIKFSPTEARAIRLTITKPRPPYCWTFAEVKVLLEDKGEF